MEIDFDKYPYPKLRHHTSANMYFPASELELLPEGYPPLYDNIDWSKRFANKRLPDMLDIGCGKGFFLLHMAELYPEKNILGIELRKGAVKWINSVIEGESIHNCSALWYSVINGMNFIKDKSIEKIFYLFPDPWPKRKQQKRRLFREPFIKDCHRALKDDGVLYLATDLDYVHEHHLNELERSGIFNYNEIKSRDEWPLPYTNKENFCKRKDIEVYRLICTKK